MSQTSSLDSLDNILGQEFLTWLWYQSDVAPGAFVDAQGQPFSVSMEQRIVVQGGEGDARERKKEIKEQVMLRLRARFLPIPAEFNVLWATDRNEIWFASTQNSMIDLFMELFLQTFELRLEQITPYTLALTLLDEKRQEQVDRIEATQFAV